jgi:hypothetical protein
MYYQLNIIHGKIRLFIIRILLIQQKPMKLVGYQHVNVEHWLVIKKKY